MRMRQLPWAAGLAALCCQLATPAAASPIERAVDMAGVTGTVALAYGDHTVNAALATVVALDSYTFAGVAGDQVRIQLAGLAAGLDPFVSLRLGGTVVNTASCVSNSLSVCSLALDQSLAASGLYTVNVSDAGANDFGAYQLHLELYPPVNNWLGLQYSTPASEALGHSTDIDGYAFNGVAGSGVALTLASQSNGLDPLLEVWDPQGTRIVSVFCSANSLSLCSTGATLDLTQNGLYRVGISEAGLNDVGNYQFQVSCIYGACPLPSAAAPVPVPEPASWLLLAAGSAVLALRRRNRRGE